MPEGMRQRIYINFRKLYSFVCFRPRYEPNHAQIGQKGYSRVVYCNYPDHLEEAVKLNYRGNYVSTTKYSAANFIPKSLFEQFRRVANIYFLVVACVSFSPLAPYSSLSILAPLIVVIGATMAKEGVEDWRRRKQVIFEINFICCAILGFESCRYPWTFHSVCRYTCYCKLFHTEIYFCQVLCYIYSKKTLHWLKQFYYFF